MSDLDWSTPDGLAAIRDHLAARIDGWRQPVAYAVGAQPRVVVAGVGVRPRQRARRSARAARRRARDACSATTGRRPPLPLSRAELAAAVESLAPARGVHRRWTTRTSPPGARCCTSSRATRPARRRRCSWPTSTTRSPRRPTARCGRPSRATPRSSEPSSGGRTSGADACASCCGPARDGRDRPTRRPTDRPAPPGRTSARRAHDPPSRPGPPPRGCSRSCCLIAVGDALLPPIPSEGVVVALAAVAVPVTARTCRCSRSPPGSAPSSATP